MPQAAPGSRGGDRSVPQAAPGDRRWLLWAIGGFGVATIIFGVSQWFWLSLLMMFVVGALDNISVVVRHTLVQMLTPDEMRGRVSAVNGVFIVASNDLGGLESGLTAWLFGPVISVVGGGVGTILVVLAAMRLWPQILRIESLSAIRPAADGFTSERFGPQHNAGLSSSAPAGPSSTRADT